MSESAIRFVGQEVGIPARSALIKRYPKTAKVLAAVALLGSLNAATESKATEFAERLVTPASSVLKADEGNPQKLRREWGEVGKNGYSLSVVTFNTASGNPDIKTAQADFPNLPFYQKVASGDARAPIVALQEVGEKQAEKLERMAEKGTFSLIYTKAANDSGLAVLIPQRFTLLSAESTYYAPETRWDGFREAVASIVHGDEVNPSQIFTGRMLTEAKLKDTLSGTEFTLFNTHLSCDKAMRLPEAKELLDRVTKAGEKGPVVVAGDFNISHIPEDEKEAAIMQRFDEAGFKDLGPAYSALNGGRIDYVLGLGTEKKSSRYLTNLTLKSADVISDHTPEKDVFRFEK